MKKIISVFLSVIMLVTSLCFAVSANASVNKMSGEYNYTFVSADKIAIKNIRAVKAQLIFRVKLTVLQLPKYPVLLM